LRRMLIAVLVLLLLFSMSITAKAEGVTAVERTITPEYGGLVYVIDKIHVSESSFRYGIVEEMHDRLVAFSVDGGDYKLIGKKTGGLYIYEIYPRSRLVTVKAIYRGLISEAGGNNYELVINAEPFIEGHAVQASIFLPTTSYVRYPVAPSGWTLTERGLEKRNVTISGSSPGEPIVVRFTSGGLALIQVESLDMSYRLSESSLVIGMKIANTAGNPLRQLDLRMPEGIEVKEVRDTLGKLIYSWSSKDRVLTINLEQSRYALQNSWKYSFTIIAKCTSTQCINTSDETARILVFTPINASISSLSVSLILPEGYEADLSKARLVEYRHDPAGAAIATIDTSGINIYDPSYFTIPIVKSPSLASTAQWLIGGGFIVLIIGTVVMQIMRGKALRPKIISEKDAQIIFKAIQELQKAKSTLLEIEESLAPTAAKAKPQLMTDKMHVVRRTADSIIESLGKIEEKPAELQRIVKEINQAVSTFSEALRVILRNYADFQRGELTMPSYKKIYDSFRKDLRYAYDMLSNIEEDLRELAKK